MSRRQKTVHLEGAAKQALETGRNRLLLASCLLTLAFIAVGGRVINLSAFRDHNEPTTQSVSTDAVLQTGRADIVDRNGLLMATSLRTPSLYADPTEVLDAEEAAATLTRVLTDLAPAEIVAKLRAKRRFVWLKRSLTPREQHAVNRLGIPGLYFHGRVEAGLSARRVGCPRRWLHRRRRSRHRRNREEFRRRVARRPGPAAAGVGPPGTAHRP